TVEGSDVTRTGPPGDPVPEPQGHPVTPVNGQCAHAHAMFPCDLGGPVGAAVVDDQRGELHTRDLIRNFVENGTKVACFVVCGYDNDQWLQLQARVRSGESLLGSVGNPGRVGSLSQPVIGLADGMRSRGHWQWCPSSSVMSACSWAMSADRRYAPGGSESSRFIDIPSMMISAPGPQPAVFPDPWAPATHACPWHQPAWYLPPGLHPAQVTPGRGIPHGTGTLTAALRALPQGTLTRRFRRGVATGASGGCIVEPQRDDDVRPWDTPAARPHG